MTYREDDRLSDAIAAQHRREREVCLCGHRLARHHQLGACTEQVRIGVAPARYCHCLDYQEDGS